MARPQRKIPWVEQRDNAFFYVHWYNPETGRTERKSLGTTDPDIAQDRYSAFLAEGRSVLARAKGTRLTVGDALDGYLREHVGVDPATGLHLADGKVADRYRQFRAAQALRSVWDATAVAAIGPDECKRYLQARARSTPPAGPTTVRRELVTLVAAVNHALRRKRLRPEDVPEIDLPPHRQRADDEMPFLTKDEIREAIRLAGLRSCPRLKAFIVLAYLSGARRKSVERLRMDQVDIPNRRLKLREIGARITKKRKPIVPLTDDMLTEIYALCLTTDNEWLFGAPHANVYKAFRGLLESMGCGDRAFPHVLRHSRATHLLQDGVPIWDVAKLLGDTVRTVETAYGHHCPEHLAGQIGARGLGETLS